LQCCHKIERAVELISQLPRSAESRNYFLMIFDYLVTSRRPFRSFSACSSGHSPKFFFRAMLSSTVSSESRAEVFDEFRFRRHLIRLHASCSTMMFLPLVNWFVCIILSVYAMNEKNRSSLESNFFLIPILILITDRCRKLDKI